ncbi:MAG: discoidin domain-containing protein, partial [Deltaproteobacteria bacterium]
AGQKPIWDTETGFWANGPYDLYHQGDAVARQLAWYEEVGVARWFYFVTEGSCANSLDFSLIANQSDNYVRPAALASMTFAAQVGKRAYLGLAPLAMPNAFAMQFGAVQGAADRALMAWTDDMPANLTLTVSPASGASPPAQVILTVTDELGASETKQVSSANGTLSLPVGGAPVYVTYPASISVTPSAPEPFGKDLALGGVAKASSELPTNPATSASDGVTNAQNGGDWVGLSLWGSAYGDPTPTLTVTLSQPQTIDRVVVYLHSLGSVVPAPRDYDVLVQAASGAWSTVAQVRGNFYTRINVHSFPALLASAIQVQVLSVNLSGYAGGAAPSFWANGSKDEPWYGPAILWEVEAYAPGQ